MDRIKPAYLPAHLYALRIICERLASLDCPWALTGSLSLALQGVEVDVADIDLQTDAQGAYLLQEHLADYLVKPVELIESENICSHFGTFEIEGQKVEVMGAIQKRLPGGDWDAHPPLTKLIRQVQVGDLRVPVLDLEYEMKAYTILGRLQKAALIGEAISRRAASSKEMA